jgi:signal transduction histidine kinase
MVLKNFIMAALAVSAAVSIIACVKLRHGIRIARMELRSLANRVSTQEKSAAYQASPSRFAVLENALNSMADAVLAADSTGKIVMANLAAEKIFGVVVGRDITQWHEDFTLLTADKATKLEYFDRPLWRATRAEEFDNQRFVLRNNITNRDYVLLATSRTLQLDPASPSCSIVVYRDITELHETEEMLLLAQKMEVIGQLTTGIAHDFNNILTVILSTIGALKEGVKADKYLSQIADVIEQASERGADITNELLTICRKRISHPATTDISVVTSNTLRLVQPLLGDRIQLSYAADEDIDHTTVEPSELATAIINLCLNARDAMPNGGKLFVEVRNAGLDDFAATGIRYVMVAVIDNGQGISKELQQKIFEPFFTTKLNGAGTGLGLSMVARFIRQSHGQIKVESEPGRGTAMKLYFPSTENESPKWASTTFV